MDQELVSAPLLPRIRDWEAHGKHGVCGWGLVWRAPKGLRPAQSLEDLALNLDEVEVEVIRLVRRPKRNLSDLGAGEVAFISGDDSRHKSRTRNTRCLRVRVPRFIAMELFPDSAFASAENFKARRAVPSGQVGTVREPDFFCRPAALLGLKSARAVRAHRRAA